MFLESLLVYDGDENLIRFVKFKDGLNLILSNTNSLSQTSSHNNVGKTTLLRVIDFCLGAKTDEDIYIDREFNRKDEALYEHIKEFYFELKFRDGLSVKRGIKNRTKLIINDKEFSLKDGQDKLKQLLFSFSKEKPTFRQLIQKFIRDNAKSMENTIKAFHETTSNADYEAIYLILFGFLEISENINEKNQILKELKNIDNGLKYFKSTPRKALEAEIKIEKKNLIELEKQIKEYKFDEFFNIYEKDLSFLTKNIRDIKQKLSLLNFKLDNSKKSLESLQYSIDAKAIEYIYREANKFIPEMQKKFEEVANYHNYIIADRGNYYKEQIYKLEKEIIENEKVLENLRKEESIYFKSVDGNPSLEDYNSMLNKKANLMENIAKKESDIKNIEKLENSKRELTDKLSFIEKNIETQSIKYKDYINIFNEFFVENTKKLYGTEWYLYEDFDKSGKNREFKIDKVGISGTGEKKAEIVAFDLAYIEFIEKIGLPYPRFVTHDGIDQISEHQKETIFEIANQINGQYILAINIDQLPQSLRDDKNFVKNNTILELSKNDRFFKFDI